MPYTVTFDPAVLSKQSQIIPNATERSDGVMTAAMVQALHKLGDLESIAIYVDSENGSDANEGTEAAPVATIARAMELKSILWTRSCRIICAAGNYPLTLGATAVGQVIYLASLATGEQASPLAFLGTAVDAAADGGKPLDDLTAAVGSTSTSYIADLSGLTGTDPALNSLRGAFLRNNVTGTRVMVTGNSMSGSLLTITLNAAATVATGNSFSIERPGTVFQLPASFGTFFNGNGTVGFKNIKFESISLPPSNNIPGLLFVLGANALFSGCEFDQGSRGRLFGAVDGGRIVGGAGTLPWNNDGTSNQFSNLELSAGIYLHSVIATLAIVNISNQSFVGGAIMADGCVISVNGGSVAVISNLQAEGTTVSAANSPNTEIQSGKMTGGGSVFGAQVLGFQSSVRLGGSFTGGGTASATGLEISSSAGGTPGVKMSQSKLQTLRLTGTANGTYGIVAQDVSNVLRNILTTITGASGDTLVGTTPKAYGALPFTEATTPGDATTCTLNRIS